MKDTSNLLDYNCWSGTEYNNNTTKFTFTGTNGIPSNEWSHIGENSLKISTEQLSQAFDIQHMTVDLGKTVTISFAIYNPNIQVRGMIRANTEALSRVTIPASKEVKIITISANVLDNYDWVALRCFLDQVGSCFIDDITFTVS